MLRLRRSLCCVLTLPVALAVPLEASEICPPKISTYEKCPNGFRQSWSIPPLPSYIDTDTVVEQVNDGLWEYHWCLKSTESADDDFYFLWRDFNWEGATECGGFWGQSLQTLYPPADVRTSLIVGPSLLEIQPNIQLPTDRIPPPPLWRRFLEYVTRISVSVPADKAGGSLATIRLTIRSTATPLINQNRQTATQYEIDYLYTVDPLSAPNIKFLFSDDIVARFEELSGSFSKPRPLEFTKPGAPTNMLGTIIFVNPDGYKVGSMPVSLAVPID